MQKNFKISAPAKINIGLRVLSKRNDVFHNIETIFYPVKLCDRINIKITPLEANKNTVSIHISPSQEIKLHDNICYKTVNLFVERFGIQKKYRIEINIMKKIPIGAGLGGGSSNAAAVLKVLSKHFKISAEPEKLLKIASEIGSDVPFFLLNKPAYATARGEKLTYLPKFKISNFILLVFPGINVSTKWAYGKINIGFNKNKEVFQNIKTFDIKTANEVYTNDFERVVFKKYPEIKKIKEKMNKSGAVFSQMSGSGSTVYGVFDKKTDLLKAKGYFKDKNYFTAEG